MPGARWFSTPYRERRPALAWAGRETGRRTECRHEIAGRDPASPGRTSRHRHEYCRQGVWCGLRVPIRGANGDVGREGTRVLQRRPNVRAILARSRTWHSCRGNAKMMSQGGMIWFVCPASRVARVGTCHGDPLTESFLPSVAAKGFECWSMHPHLAHNDDPCGRSRRARRP